MENNFNFINFSFFEIDSLTAMKDYFIVKRSV